MQNNNILNFINSIEIKHKDIPHILILLSIIFGASLIGWFFWNITGLITAAILFISTITICLQFDLYRATQRHMVYQQQKFQDYLTLYKAIDFKAPIGYMAGYAASPELARTVYEKVIELKPDYVVELGSGITSIISAYGLEHNGTGLLLSIDHNEKYMQLTINQLKNHGLDNRATVKYGKLTNQKVNDHNKIWYDISNITFEKPIDLLLIDGPPEQIQSKARYPALPLLFTYLSESSVIILDDAKRPSTQEVIKDWQKEFPVFCYRYIDTDRGIGIFSR